VLTDPLERHLLRFLGGERLGRLELAKGLVIDIGSIVEEKLLDVGRSDLTSTLLDQVQNLGDFCNIAQIARCKLK